MKNSWSMKINVKYLGMMRLLGQQIKDFLMKMIAQFTILNSR